MSDTRGDEPAPGRLIVQREERRLYEYVRESFAGFERVEVLLDRRRMDRRRRANPTGEERRQGERRRLSEQVEEQLRSRGWAFIYVGRRSDSRPDSTPQR